MSLILGSFVIVGLLLTAVGVWTMFYARQTWNWSRTRGLVEYLDVCEEEGGSYSVAVRYRYTVNGEEYVSDRVSMVDWSATYSKAERKVNTIRSNIDQQGKLLIRYNPAKPGSSIVEPGITPDVILYFAIAAGITVVSGVLWFWLP